MMCCYIQECLQLASKTQHLIQLTCDGSHLEKKNKILEWEENHKIFWELTSLLSFIACCDTVIPCLANCSIEIVVTLLPPLKQCLQVHCSQG